MVRFRNEKKKEARLAEEKRGNRINWWDTREEILWMWWEVVEPTMTSKIHVSIFKNFFIYKLHLILYIFF